MNAGLYFVVCPDTYYDGAIVPCNPKVIVARYFGNGDWDTELLKGENYKVIPVTLPKLEDFE